MQLDPVINLMAAILVLFRLVSTSQMIPCLEFHAKFDIPCLCGLNSLNATIVNCDGAVFEEFPLLPHRFYIHKFSQRRSGLQMLSTQLFTASDIPLVTVDFSHNRIRRVTGRMFEGIETTLEDVNLEHNLLGVLLNPLFSSEEFNRLNKLKTLNLGYNRIKELEDGIFRDCVELKDLILSGNILSDVPTKAINGPRALQNIQLQENRILNIDPFAFKSQPKLLSINLTSNYLSKIESGAFRNLTRLVRLIITRNQLTHISDNAFSDLSSLIELDLSQNFLETVPLAAVSNLKKLQYLGLGSNRLKTIQDVDFPQLASLQYLDLSRNLLRVITPGNFMGMTNLKGLDFSVNVVRKVDENAFAGLDQLEYLDLSDNQILSLPGTALGRLPLLKRLKMDYNRIGAFNYEILRSIKGVEELSLAYNIIREIPNGTFGHLNQLKILNMYGNQIDTLNVETFAGTENTLEYLDLGYNAIRDILQINFPLLKYINLERNFISRVGNAFQLLHDVESIVLRDNQINEISVEEFANLSNLISLDISGNKIRSLSVGIFVNEYLNEINVSSNALTSISTKTFSNLDILEILDLSGNSISTISDAAFDRLPRLKSLLLHHNKLTSYKGEFHTYDGPFNDTQLITLDLSYNELTYIYPESFSQHPNLQVINFSHNKFGFFPAQFIKNLDQLQNISLSHNVLKNVDEADFSNMKSLRSIDLSSNDIERIGDLCFQNSSQLQYVYLQRNLLNELQPNSFKGLIRLHLDASHNNLTELPEKIFHLSKVSSLQYLDISHNHFTDLPVEVLQGQYFFLDTLKVSHNDIVSIPSDKNILVNIKDIDLSFNNLSVESITNVLNEPKTVHRLNMAGTGISHVPVLETPYLMHLNLSHNRISSLDKGTFVKPSLNTLDLSYNQIPNLSYGILSVWPDLSELIYLDISHNPLAYIVEGDFKYLESLEVLKITHLNSVTKIEPFAFANLKRLKVLEAFGYPDRLNSLNVREILKNFNALEIVRMEVTEKLLGDHLSHAFSHRLVELGVMGSKVKNIAIGAFVGLSGKSIGIQIDHTKISHIPSAIFFPVPMSTQIRLDVSNNQLSKLGPQLLNTFSSKQRHISLNGLNSNPIFCDCNAKALRMWLKDVKHNEDVLCVAPTAVAGQLITSLQEDQMVCHDEYKTTTTEIVYIESRDPNSSPAPIIITQSDTTTSVRSTFQQPGDSPLSKSSPYNMDALIIGIVGGVVLFIAIVMIIICLVRLRLSDNQYRGGPMAGPLALRAQGKCTCLKPGPHTVYSGGPAFLPYNSTLPLNWGNTGRHLAPTGATATSLPGTVGPRSYLSGTVVSRGSQYPPPVYPPSMPYYVTFPPEEDSEGDDGEPSCDSADRSQFIRR